MANILIWVSPEPGHLLPTIKFAGELKSRNHRVVYLSCGQILDELCSLGFEVMPFLEVHKDMLHSRSVMSPCRPAHVMYQQLRRQYPTRATFHAALREEIRRAAHHVRADLVLVDGVFNRFFHLQLKHILEKKHRIAYLCTHLPYQERGRPNEENDGADTIYLSPPAFEIPRYRDARARYTEASIYNGALQNSDAWKPEEEKDGIIYCSLGTQAELYSATQSVFGYMLAATKSFPANHFVINVCSTNLDEVFPGNQIDTIREMANVSLVRFAPQAQVLQSAKIVITHGGFGTVKEAIYFGVPMLVLPQQWDQLANAERVAYHQVGINGSKELSGASIADKLRTLLTDPQIRSNIARMGDQFRQREQTQATACACEEILL